ncbi:hypothetical protein M422DRAFT_275061 [Sphaerobolus stellatus SS14]|uniref:Unplaced genomic scaffold SPHSTscaffold_441, whole genome shotgun sequence n=1 Tax=Sphaerobolus stellatus (strain SS14) TaxID=990650 RepID=A0A0C9UFF4_SPHS4|nr:hypothetical protein M422DRAFT_275061 [Sphaerobolus stellatus SS14]
MTDLQLPARMLAWKASTDVVRMEEVPIGDPRRTVQGFVPDNKFDAPAPKLIFDDPYEEEKDRLNKVTKYWKVCDQERLMRESRYRELRGAEEAAASRKRSEDAAKKLKEAQEKEAARDLEKEKEKEKGNEKEAGPSGSAKGKAKEVLKTPKKTTPKKSKRDVRSESEEKEEPEGSEERLACVYCVQKKIKCELLDGRKVCAACHRRKVKCEFFDKTAWAVMDGSEKIAEAVRDLTKLERRRMAGLLEKSWYDLNICALNLEQTVDRDLMEADGKVLTLLDMKPRGVEIPADVEKRVIANRGSIVASYTTHMEHIFTQMNLIRKHTAWTKNDLPESTIGEPEAGPSIHAEESGNKRKAEEDEGCAERSEKKKRKKVWHPGGKCK